MSIKKFQKFNENYNNIKCLMIIKSTNIGGDYIIINILDISLFEEIVDMIDNGLESYDEKEELLNFINENSLDIITCEQEDFVDYQNKYEISRIVYLPQLNNL